MTQVNLLPSDVRERQRSRRLVAAAVAAVGAVVALLFFVFVLQSARLSNTEQKLKAQQAVNLDLQNKVAQLQKYADLKQTLAAREALKAGALNGQVAWSGVLRDISMVIPNQMWLTGMSASLTDTSALPSSGTPPTTGTVGALPVMAGAIQFQGMASDFPTVAKWLVRLEQVRGWENAWASSATKGTVSSTSSSSSNETKVQFTASVDLTSEATVQGSKQ